MEANQRTVSTRLAVLTVDQASLMCDQLNGDIQRATSNGLDVQASDDLAKHLKAFYSSIYRVAKLLGRSFPELPCSVLLTCHKGHKVTGCSILEKIGDYLPVFEDEHFTLPRQNQIEEIIRGEGSQEAERMDEAMKNLLSKVVLAVRLHYIFSRIDHKSIDNNEYELLFINTSEPEIIEQTKDYFELGSVTRMLTKRFIRTVRGSSYEVDLQYHESVSLLHNIRNQLLRFIMQQLGEYHLSSSESMWVQEDTRVLITQGLSFQARGNYESLLQDSFFLELFQTKHKNLEMCKAIGDVVRLVKDKTQLKYVDSKVLETQINKLEAGGELRPNMDNNQGFTGIQLFCQMSYFKLYRLEDCCYKNSSYVSKDVEDWFEHHRLSLPWKDPICEYFSVQTHSLISKPKAINVDFGSREQKSLKDKILVRFMRSLDDRADVSKSKFVRSLKSAARKATAFKLLEVQYKRSNFKKFAEQSRKMKELGDVSQSQAAFRSLQLRYLTFRAVDDIHELAKACKQIRGLSKTAQKFAYVTKLTAKAESFYTIKRYSQQSAKLQMCLKIADNFLRVLFKAKQSSTVAIGFSLILRKSKEHAQLIRLHEVFVSATTRSKQECFSAIKFEAEASKKRQELENKSLVNLRKNYLLNNVAFILKYNFSMQKQIQQRTALCHIRQAADAKREFQQKVKKLCDKVESAMRRKFARMTLGSFTEYRSKETTHNYKIGFHFLELYVKRKILSGAWQMVKQSQGSAERWMICFEKIEGVFNKGLKTRGFDFMKRKGLLEKGLHRLRMLLEKKRSSVKHHYGKQLLYGLAAVRKLRRQRVQQRVQIAARVLGDLFKRRAFKQISQTNKASLSKTKIALIKIELFFLKGQKQAYRAGFFSLHKKWVKNVHQDTKTKVQVRHKAASVIQAFLKMIMFRRYYRYILTSVALIQRAVRGYISAKRARRHKIVSQIALQRKRMTQIRETAVQRFKENLSSDKEVFNRRHNFSKKTEFVSAKDYSLEVIADNLIADPHVSHTSAKLGRMDRRKQAWGKENDASGVAGRQPASKMKLNMDSNQLENIKRYKNKVISNQIKQREKEVSLKDAENPSLDRQTAKAGKGKVLKALENDPGRENLQDLISGVKSKIHQIRETQRSKPN